MGLASNESRYIPVARRDSKGRMQQHRRDALVAGRGYRVPSRRYSLACQRCPAHQGIPQFPGQAADCCRLILTDLVFKDIKSYSTRMTTIRAQ